MCELLVRTRIATAHFIHKSNRNLFFVSNFVFFFYWIIQLSSFAQHNTIQYNNKQPKLIYSRNSTIKQFTAQKRCSQLKICRENKIKITEIINAHLFNDFLAINEWNAFHCIEFMMIILILLTQFTNCVPKNLKELMNPNLFGMIARQLGNITYLNQ